MKLSPWLLSKTGVVRATPTTPLATALSCSLTRCLQTPGLTVLRIQSVQQTWNNKKRNQLPKMNLFRNVTFQFTVLFLWLQIAKEFDLLFWSHKDFLYNWKRCQIFYFSASNVELTTIWTKHLNFVKFIRHFERAVA